MGKGKSAKVRFDGLDVTAIVGELGGNLAGRRVINIYDGESDADSFLFKLDGSEGKTLLFLESGFRIHVTNQPSLQQEGMPSPFCSKLRKHLRGLRLERISQLGNYDRVVLLVFGTGASRHSLILELYARGNLILTNASYEILSLLRSHDYEDHAVQVKVGEVYPVSFATSIKDMEGKGNESATPKDILTMTGDLAIEWAESVICPGSAAGTTKKGKKSDSGTPLKALLLKPSSGVYQYGPSLLEHCILCAGLDPNLKLKPDSVCDVLQPSEWETLVSCLKEEGTKVMNAIAGDDIKGYIIYHVKPGNEGGAQEIHADGLQHHDKILEEFQPHLLRQHQGKPFIQYDCFSKAVDDYFAHIGSQKQALRAEGAEAAARDRLEKVRRDLTNRIESLHKEQERFKVHAQLVELYAEDVDKALDVINSALDTGMDWAALEQLIETEQKNQNPIALLIKGLDLEKDTIVLALPNSLTHGDNDKDSPVHVTVSLRESAFGNASLMFAKYRAAKEKSEKTEEATHKALKAAEATTQRDLQAVKLKSKLTIDMTQKRKPHWFEKFHWMISSENYLVVGGKDAQQNEMLVKRYLRPGDAYLHADVHGASSCILRAKRRRTEDGKTEPVALADQALREAGTFAICHSSAWASRMVTSAWWVESHQVSKTAPTGEYLTVGSFMVRGKKVYLPPSQLEMGLAVLFRLGDEDSIARHRNERRDFALLENPENPEDDEALLTTETLKPRKVAKAKPRTGDATAYERRTGALDTLESAETSTSDDDLDDAPLLESNGGRSSPAGASTDKKKKGLSVKERKLMKKHGSLEAAERAAAEAKEKEDPSVRKDEESTTATASGVPDNLDVPVKRGKKSKLKRAAKKYADQDDEDRELALLALHAGEKKSKTKAGKNVRGTVSAAQEKVAAETAALLVSDAAAVADQLPKAVSDILAECVTTKDPAISDPDSVVVRWDKFDGDVLEQIVELESEELQLAAAERLRFLKHTTRIDNFSASLAGIIRTIQKYGHENLERGHTVDESDMASKRKTKLEKDVEEEAWKVTLAREGIVDFDEDQDAIDDTGEISKLTGKPHQDDSILYAIPVCAPYHTVSQYKYRVKLNPGNLKRGKAAKQCVEILTKPDGDKTPSGERCRELIKRVGDNEWVQVMWADVKLSAPGVSKAAKKQKSGGKKGMKK